VVTVLTVSYDLCHAGRFEKKRRSDSTRLRCGDPSGRSTLAGISRTKWRNQFLRIGCAGVVETLGICQAHQVTDCMATLPALVLTSAPIGYNTIQASHMMTAISVPDGKYSPSDSPIYMIRANCLILIFLLHVPLLDVLPLPLNGASV